VCNSCDSGLSIVSNTTHSVCKCPSGFYGIPNTATDQLQCSFCDGNCASCEYNSANCTSCASPNYLFIDATYEGECIADCPTQQSNMYNDAADRKCKECGDYCLSCTGASACTNCDLGYPAYNHNGDCKLSCPGDTLTDAVLYTCTDCDTNCAHCVTTFDNCDQCKGSYKLYGDDCIANCPTGMYSDSSRVCQNCPVECTECKEINMCTDCDYGSGYYFVNY